MRTLPAHKCRLQQLETRVDICWLACAWFATTACLAPCHALCVEVSAETCWHACTLQSSPLSPLRSAVVCCDPTMLGALRMVSRSMQRLPGCPALVHALMLGSGACADVGVLCAAAGLRRCATRRLAASWPTCARSQALTWRRSSRVPTTARSTCCGGCWRLTRLTGHRRRRHLRTPTLPTCTARRGSPRRRWVVLGAVGGAARALVRGLWTCLASLFLCPRVLSLRPFSVPLPRSCHCCTLFNALQHTHVCL